MAEAYYPPSPVVVLRVIRDSVKSNPHYLDDSPYTDEELDFLKDVLLGDGKTDTQYLSQSGDLWKDLITETSNIYNSLRQLGDTLKNTKDVKDRMAYFRTATALLDKIIGMRERAHGIRDISIFQAAVMEVIEDVLTADQRIKVMSDLKARIEVADPTDEDRQVLTDGIESDDNED